MVLNPIIAREVRVRWRTWGSPALVLFLLAGLALAMGAAYSDQNYRLHNDGTRGAQSAGRGIFVILSFLQMGAWLLLSPVLTAMNIAAERERGLLESLQLSPLRAWQIAGGKLFSAAAFIGLLALTTLPITGLTFLMGGVSPYEFFGAAALHLLAALTGASIGLFFSAQCRRPLQALILSLIAVGVWFFSAFVLAAYAQGAFSPAPRGTTSVPRDLAAWATFFNPMLSLWILLEPRELTSSWGVALPGPAHFPYWSIFPGFAVATTLLSLCGAARAVRKPFEPAYPNDRHWLSFLGGKTRAKSGSAAGAGAQTAPIEAGLLRELRLDQWVHFQNPILRREVRGPLRFRRAKAWQGILQLIIASLVLGFLFLQGWFALSDAGARSAIWSFLLNVWFIGVMMTCAIWSARSFARERENGLAESIWLSMLSPREIITAKLVAPLTVIGLYSVPIWTVLALTIDWQGTNESSYNSPTLPLEALAALLIAASTAYFICCLGLYISYRSKRVTNAVITVIVMLLLLWCVAPIFVGSMLSAFGAYNHHLTDRLLHMTHPFVAINDIRAREWNNDYSKSTYTYVSWFYILVATGAGSLFLSLLLAITRNGARESETFLRQRDQSQGETSAASTVEIDRTP